MYKRQVINRIAMRNLFLLIALCCVAFSAVSYTHLSDYHNSLNELGKTTVDELCHYKGIGPAKAKMCIRDRNKVVIKEKKLYVASEQGLFVVRNLEKDFKRPVIDSLVTNVSVYNDTVYALSLIHIFWLL